MKKVLLYSGGMDSWLISKIWKPDVLLYINLHSRYSAEEIKRLPENVEVVDLNIGALERADAIIPLRNLYMVSMATNYGDEICLGATYGDRVLDKSKEFAVKTSDLLTYLYQEQHWTKERKIKINVDFKQYTKRELLKMFIDAGGNIDEAYNQSFSCYDPTDGHECWQCKPCFRKFIAFYLNGMDFDTSVKLRVKNYLEKEIMPSVTAGTYGRGQKEEDDIKEVYSKLCNDLKL